MPNQKFGIETPNWLAARTRASSAVPRWVAE